MRRIRILARWLLYIIGGFIFLLACLWGYVAYVSRINPPAVSVSDKETLQWKRADHPDHFYTIGNNWLRKSASGLFEMYVEGDAFERGVANGKLSRELLVQQEDYFSNQIRKMIPSDFYLHFLKYVIGWFNRHLDQYVIDEYKREIYGISESASNEYKYIGTNYQRILNYHAAHDIGHALQNMALVGCTSFATWDGASADSSLIIGRNFDFYVSDDFAKNKIILFENPAEGYKFMSVTWGGFIGVVSGMNEKGLTVTINAAKSRIPPGSATPVSLVAREILQYAANIQQAIAIAHKRTMFVSESFLIGSAADHKAVIIEKTPDTMDVYDPQSNHILCANHYQSKILVGSESNVEQMRESASAYRYKRLEELMEQQRVNTVQKTVEILRDRKGLGNTDIGWGNEKALNQLISHHAIVFEPEKRRVWVSTAPWQLGEFVAYDLNKVFKLPALRKNHEIYDSSLTIPADPFLLTDSFHRFEKYRMLKNRMHDGLEIDPDSLIADNPQFYHSYVLAGDYCIKKSAYRQALEYYEEALTKEIATKPEENYIKGKIDEIRKILNKK